MWKFVLFIGLLVAVVALPADYNPEKDEAELLEKEFQGDMIISQADLDAFNGRIDPKLKWTNNIVPYKIDMTFFSKFL